MANRLRLTKEVQETILRHLKSGAFRKHAAEAAGVSEDAVNVWLKRGAAGEKPYAAFFVAVRKVQAEDAIRSQAIITTAQLKRIDGDWKAAAWSLERKYPKLYGPNAAPQIGISFEPAEVDNGTRTKIEFYMPDNGRRPTVIDDDDEGEADKG